MYLAYKGKRDFLEEASKINYILSLTSIEDKIFNGGIVAGGTIRSLFSDEKTSDVDIYPLSARNAAIMIRNIKSEFKKRNNKEKYDETKREGITYESDRAVTYIENGIKFQIIYKDDLLPDKPSTSSKLEIAENIMDKFDFSVCMGSYIPEDDLLVLHQNFLIDISRKKLRYNTNTSHPINSIARMKKFLNKGYRIDEREIIKIAMTISSLEIRTWQEVASQLQGMDEPLMGDFYEHLKLRGDEFNFDIFYEEMDRYISAKMEESIPTELPF